MMWERVKDFFSCNSFLNFSPSIGSNTSDSSEEDYRTIFSRNSPGVAELFLLNTKNSAHELRPRIISSGLRGSMVLNRRRSYAQEDIARLPKILDVDVRLDVAIKARRSQRKFIGKKIDLDLISTVLYYASGITGKVKSPWGSMGLEAHPSAGALYPITLYLVSLNAKHLGHQVYRYDQLKHMLIRTKDYDLSRLLEVFIDPEDIWVDRACFLLVFVADIWKTMRKYGDRGLRYVFIECGEIAENVHFVAQSLGLGSVDIGGFFDKKLEDLLGIDGLLSCAVHSIAIGVTR